MLILNCHVFQPFRLFQDVDTSLEMTTSQKVASVGSALITFGVASGSLLLFIFLSPSSLVGLCSLSTALALSLSGSSLLSIAIFYLTTYVQKRILFKETSAFKETSTGKPDESHSDIDRQNGLSKVSIGLDNSEPNFENDSSSLCIFGESSLPSPLSKQAKNVMIGLNPSIQNIQLQQKADEVFIARAPLEGKIYKIIALDASRTLIPLKKSCFHAEGTFKKVRKAIWIKSTNQRVNLIEVIYAKMIIDNLEDGALEVLKREKVAARKYQNVNGVVHTFCYFDYKNRKGQNIFVLVQSLCNKGELFNFIESTEFKRLTLLEKRKLQYKMLAALVEIHKRGDIHRDIKLENIFLNQLSSGELEPVIGDMGFLINDLNLEDKEKFAGTPVYTSPETCARAWYKSNPPINQRCDVWSMGVVFAYMEKLTLFGKYTNINEFTTESFDYFASLTQDFFQEPQEGVFRHLIWEMLRTDPKYRLTSEEAFAKLGLMIQKMEQTIQ